ncbi:MAG TPA: hypothetical protein VHD62_00040 [Opitutaceae bacterium]|nr:hypothetical protein [Opitutaceae bacterium]
MIALRPSAKIGIVCFGCAAALVLGCVSVSVRHWLLPLPPEEANGGMAAFGDLLQAIAVAGVVAVVPLALALYWLRAVERFWTSLQRGAALFAATGVLALLAFVVGRKSPGGWLLVSMARIGVMPLCALALATCAAFAPQPRQRWWLFAAAVSDAAMFLGYLLTIGAFAALLRR